MYLVNVVKITGILVLLLFLASCSGERQHSSAVVQNDSSLVGDTSEINRLLSLVSSGHLEDTDFVLTQLSKAKELSEKIGYPEGTARAYLLEGNLFYDKNRYDKALESYSQSLELAEEMEIISLKAQCLERLASLQLTLGDDHLALKLYYDALPLFEKTGDKAGIAKVYNIVGIYKGSKGEYDTAESYFLKAMKLNEEAGNHTGIIHNKSNLAFMYHRMGQTEKAKDIYLRLVPELIGTGDSIDLPVIYYHLSMFCNKLSENDSVLYYLKKSLAVSERLADTSILATLYGKIGEIFLDHRQYDSALVFLTKSVSMSETIKDYVTWKQALKLLLTIDTFQHNYKKAAEKYEKIIVLSDSVYNRRIRNGLESSELRYENQKKSNLIGIQNIELKSANRQKQFLLAFFIFSAITCLLLILLTVLIKRNNRRKQELLVEKLRTNELELENARKDEEIGKFIIANVTKELSLRESELVSNALAVQQKNELLGQINNKLNEAMAGDGTLKLKDLNGIVSAIRSQVMDSDTFNQKFSQLHQGFFDRLKMSHPGLTQSELKFCAYLKLHLNSSQIASITNVTPEAIRKTRYRIRKKLTLQAGESLEDYISRF